VNPKNFFAELKRRKVYKVAIAYGVVAWLLMQVASQIFPFFEIPNWGVRLVVLLLVIGFPVALILAWAFELTPEGIKRTEDVDLSKLVRRKTGRKLDFFIIAVVLLVIGILLFQRLHPNVSPAVSSSLEKSIAVLPFENFSEDKAFAFFADGVQDEILTDLAKIADLKVISRTSMMQYKGGLKRNLPEIAQALKVAHVLEGSVQRSENRVRVSAQLIDARNDTHVWAEKYDRELADVFAIQSEIAEKIADQLQAKLSPTEKSAMNERPRLTWLPTISTCEQKDSFTTAMLFPLVEEKIFLTRCSFSNKRSRATRPFSSLIVSSRMRTMIYTCLTMNRFVRTPLTPVD